MSDHIQFDTTKIHPRDVRQGMFIMVMSRTMTDELGMVPRMQAVDRIRHTVDRHGKKYEFTTREGIYNFREGDRVEVVT